jgi:hypothetical protein
MYLRTRHFGIKMVLPKFGRGQYFVPDTFGGVGKTEHRIHGTTFLADGPCYRDHWEQSADWDFYQEPQITPAPTPVPEEVPKDFSLLEAVLSGKKFRNAKYKDTPDVWIHVNPEDTVLYWYVSGEPYVMCEFNLAARYLLEPEPRAPALVTEETLDAAWKKAFELACKKTDCTFRECLKEALGLKDAAEPKKVSDYV